MTLHPQAQAWLAAAATAPGPGEPGYDLAADRQAYAAAGLERLDGADAAGDELDRVVDVDADGVPARLYLPRPGAPVVVHLHGGGWVVGDLDSHDAVCRLLAARSGSAVLAVDYRRAPEHPWPAALLDAEAAAAWVRREAPALEVDAARMAVLGDSAGGALAAAVALRAREREALEGTPSPYAAQVLVYPAVDARCASGSHGSQRHGLTRERMLWYWDAYVPQPADRLRPDVSPALATDLAGLPPAAVVTAEHDPLRDEGEDYAARLAAAGVPVVATRWLGMVHGFWRRPAAFPDAAPAAVDAVAAFLRSRLGG